MLNTNLDALYHFGHSWNIEFAPSKTSSLIVSLKSNTSEHPPMTCISEVSSNDVLGFTLLLRTWQDHNYCEGTYVSIKGSNNLANYIDVVILILVMIHLSFRNLGSDQQLNMDAYYILVQHQLICIILILYKGMLNI